MTNPYYTDDYCTIYHGDCREILPILDKVDLVLTDPPYGVNKNYSSYDDTVGVGWIVEFLFSIDCPKIITCGVNNIWKYPEADWVLCWYKPNAMSLSCVANANVWEPILVYDVKNFGVDGKTVTIAPQKDTGCHPCPKPIKLFIWLLHRQKHKTILDPFMGSGTTLRAAKDLQRKSIGIEIEEKYCEIAAKRLAQEVLPL